MPFLRPTEIRGKNTVLTVLIEVRKLTTDRTAERRLSAETSPRLERDGAPSTIYGDRPPGTAG